MNALVQVVETEQDHGWGEALEVGVFVYWLECGTSYRVVSEAFDIPRTTIHGTIHQVAHDTLKVFKRVLHLPDPDELEEIGAGFANLADSPAFRHVAGSIDGTHITIKPPAENREDYFNRKLFTHSNFKSSVTTKASFYMSLLGFWCGA